MSWLLSEYLDNSESPRRCKSRAAIFNSRVRRLTHLLVHVDTSQADEEELKPPTKSSEFLIHRFASVPNLHPGVTHMLFSRRERNEKCHVPFFVFSGQTPREEQQQYHRHRPLLARSGTVAGGSRSPPSKRKHPVCFPGFRLSLTFSWQVKKFLELSCNLPDFVERYQSLYLRLKNAMEELFGQQTAFVLALRQGFSAALLQLSILQAMHVRPASCLSSNLGSKYQPQNKSE